MLKEEIPEKSSGDDSFASPVAAARLGPVFSSENVLSGSEVEFLSLEAREQKSLELRRQVADQEILIHQLQLAVNEKKFKSSTAYSSSNP